MNGAKSVWVVLLAILGVVILWAWATGRAAKLIAALSGATPTTATTTPAVSTSGSNPSPSIAQPTTYVAAPTISGLGLTMPTIPTFINYTPPASMTSTPAVSALSSLPAYSSTAQVPSSYVGSASWFDSLFNGASAQPLALSNTTANFSSFDSPDVVASNDSVWNMIPDNAASDL